MPHSSLLGLALLLLSFQQQPYPPLYPNGNPPPLEHRLPIDQPEHVSPRGNQRRIDVVQLNRKAEELAKLAGEIPFAVDQANKGMLPKDLGERLRRIEKLSKQLRRELYP